MGARVGFSLKAKSPGPAVYFQRDTNVYMCKSVSHSHSHSHLPLPLPLPLTIIRVR